MCFSAKISLITFLVGLLFSLLLFFFGNKKYNIQNKIAGMTLIFINLVQFMDYLFWIDLDNKRGINKIMTILGPILVNCQPLFAYIITLYFINPFSNMKTFDYIIFFLNLFYLIYFIIYYYNFLNKDKELITGVNKYGHLHWPWSKYFIKIFYLLLLAINLFNLKNFNYSLILFLITYFFLFLSIKLFYYNIGELWCVFGNLIPLLMLIIGYYI